MEKQIREIIEKTNFKFYGIRGEDEIDVKVGDILENSYYWNYDEDRTTYGHGDEELDGTCVTLVRADMSSATAPYFDLEEEFNGDFEAAAEGVLNALEWHKKQYGYDNIYLVGGDVQGVGLAGDDNELILNGAKVLLKLQ